MRPTFASVWLEWPDISPPSSKRTLYRSAKNDKMSHFNALLIVICATECADAQYTYGNTY